jgi:hypothetical protein
MVGKIRNEGDDEPPGATVPGVGAGELRRAGLLDGRLGSGVFQNVSGKLAAAAGQNCPDFLSRYSAALRAPTRNPSQIRIHRKNMKISFQ